MLSIITSILCFIDNVFIDFYGYRALVGGKYEYWIIDKKTNFKYWFRVVQFSSSMNTSKPCSYCHDIIRKDEFKVNYWTRFFPVIDNTKESFEMNSIMGINQCQKNQN